MARVFRYSNRETPSGVAGEGRLVPGEAAQSALTDHLTRVNALQTPGGSEDSFFMLVVCVRQMADYDARVGPA